MIRHGDVFWVVFGGSGSEPRGRRPAVVIQHDRFNRSAIATTVVAAVTSNLRLAGAPGNVRLRKGEANLPRACVVNVSQLGTIDRERLVDRVGTLSTTRVDEIRHGLALLFGIGPPG